MCGVQVQGTDLKDGGAARATKNYRQDVDTANVPGRITVFKQGPRVAYDEYIVEWGDGSQERLKLEQVHRLIRNNTGPSVTALPSSVRLLTADFCCSGNHRLRRGGRYGGSCRGDAGGGGGASGAVHRTGVQRWTR